MQLTAVDADQGENARISYSLAIPTDRFYIDEKSGIIYTNGTLSFQPRNPVIHLVVKATDHGQPSKSAVVPVRVNVHDVNSYPPKFTKQIYK